MQNYGVLDGWMAYWLAGYQMEHDNYFVVAYPRFSASWDTDWMDDLNRQPGVSYTTVYLDAYDPDLRQATTLTLIHNLTSEAMKPLVRKFKRKSNVETKIHTDDYPVAFCENVCMKFCKALKCI